jgi:hypothetical protein
MHSSFPEERNTMSETDKDSTIRKEVFEHLRNIQKAEEISAKRTGINIWVLWGALWFVAWKLFDNANLVASPAFIQTSLSLILISQVFQLLIQPSPKNTLGEEPRFVNFNALSLSETPSALIISFLWFVLPSVTYWMMFGLSFISMTTGGLILLVFGLIVWSEIKNRNRFPKPIFKSASKFGDYILHLILASACANEAINFVHLVPSVDAEVLRMSILFVTAYWLIYLLLETLQKHHNDAWTYRTERELLLGFISTSEALSRIEFRYLGTRLSGVVENYWSNISSQFEVANKLLSKFKEESAEIQKIPAQYTEERKARAKKSVTLLNDAIQKLFKDIEEFSGYITELLDSQKVTPDKNIIEAIKNAMQRNKQTRINLEELISAFKIEQEKLKIEPDIQERPI